MYSPFGGNRVAVKLSIVAGLVIGTVSVHAQDAARATASTSGTMENSMQYGAKGVPQPSAPAANKASMEDSKLMRDLARINLAEIKMAGLAQSISADEKIRSFAQAVLDHHGDAMEDLRKLAQAKGAILPGGVEKDHAAALQQLALLRGTEFDQQFLTQAAAKAGQQSLQLFQQVETRTKDAELAAYAAKYLPLIQRHMQLAQQVQANATTLPATAGQ